MRYALCDLTWPYGPGFLGPNNMTDEKTEMCRAVVICRLSFSLSSIIMH
jgi:hypothetical protein